MQLICSPLGIANTEHPGQGLNDIEKANFEETVLDFRPAAPSGVLEQVGKRSFPKGIRGIAVQEPPRLEECMQVFLDKAKSTGLHFSIGYAPFLQRDTKHVDLNDKVKELAIESIKICGKVNCGALVVRPLSAGIERGRIWEENKKFYLELAECAVQSNVMILLENQCKNVNGHLVRGICADEADAVQWIDELNREAEVLYGPCRNENGAYFGFCMNVGTCNLCGQNMYDYTLAIGERLKAVIVRDCNGDTEASLLPFTCVSHGAPQTDWLNLIRGLRRIKFDGKLILDMGDTAIGYVPMLKPQLLNLAKATMDYIKWQIEMEGILEKYPSKVLFGAGNMCRNYMKNYGTKYPPLFTCDNNKALWGSEFEGLEIRSPEELKNLPSETAIFICNIYYREIEAQLREMGIVNPIEFFNDEYLPTFHFDRIDAVTRQSTREV